MKSGEFQFLYWQWLLLIPLVWVYLIIWFKTPRKNISPAIVDVDLSAYNHFYYPLVKQLIQASSSKQPIQNALWKSSKFWWQGSAISALIIALAQPVLIGERLPDPPPERDIVFLVDASVSMQLKDYKINDEAISRMDVLRNLLDEFATKMVGEKISIIIFAEQAHMLVPLSDDQNLIRRMISRITTTLAGRYSAVGDALLLALHEANKQTDRHQTFILFTDADTSRGKVTPAAAAELVAESKIPVFTIAIGSSQNNENETVEGGLYQAVDLALLEDISKRTSGQSYQVNNAETMQQALQNILKQRQNIAVPEVQYERQSLYIYPLLFGLLLLLVWQMYRFNSEAKLIT